MKRKKRERESRKKVKTNPISQKREREKEGGMFHNRRGKGINEKIYGKKGEERKE